MCIFTQPDALGSFPTPGARRLCTLANTQIQVHKFHAREERERREREEKKRQEETKYEGGAIRVDGLRGTYRNGTKKLVILLTSSLYHENSVLPYVIDI